MGYLTLEVSFNYQAIDIILGNELDVLYCPASGGQLSSSDSSCINRNEVKVGV